jgi:zinc D-Ala-D-Ala carboxypeptidase
MQLTEHFSLEELIASEVAARSGIDNTPPANIVSNLRVLAQGLERVRAAFGGKNRST